MTGDGGRLGRAAAFLAVFVCFTRMLHPGYKLDDSPETVAACVTLGVQHPPGYPLPTLAGRLAGAIPAGSPSFRVNLLAAGCGAAGCALLGPLAGAALAGCVLFWETSLSAKGGLYTLTLALLLAAVAVASRAPRSPAPWLLAGLGLAAHWMTVACWLPVLAALGRPWTRKRAALAAAAAALGGSAYLELPLRGAGEMVFGNPVTWRGFLDIVLRRELLAPVAAKPPSTGLAQALWNGFVPLREGGLGFLLLAALGAPALLRTDRRRSAALLAGALATALAVAVVANPVHQRSGELVLWFTAPFLLPVLAAAASALGAAPAAAGRWRGAVLAGAWLVVAVNGIAGLRERDHARDYLGPDFAHNMTAGLPRDAVLLTEMEFNGMPALAARHVDGAPVRLAVTNPFLTRGWGWRRLAARLPEAGPFMHDPRPPDVRLVALCDALLRSGPVYASLTTTFPALRSRLRPQGIVQRVVPAGAPTALPDAPEVDRVLRRLRLRGLYADVPPKDPLTLVALDAYLYYAILPAERDRMAGRLPAVIAGYRRALRLPGWFVRASTLRDLGLAQALTGDHAGAEASFLAAARLTPGNATLWANVAAARARRSP